MRHLLTAAALTLFAAAASAAAPKPFVIDCPAQPASKRLPTRFAWDGTDFKQTREDGRTFVRKVEAAKEGRRKGEQGDQQLLSFQLAPTADGKSDRRDYAAIEIVRDAKQQIDATFFKMASIESGFLTETLLVASQGCKMSGG